LIAIIGSDKIIIEKEFEFLKNDHSKRGKGEEIAWKFKK